MVVMLLFVLLLMLIRSKLSVGFTENPCPHLGNIVTIKLSEADEVVTLSDGSSVTKIVETHFQMNYQAGEWKRIKKYRKADEVVAAAAAPGAAAAV